MADLTRYQQVRMTTGVFGTVADMCLTCGVLLPTGVEVGGETPRQAHTRFHASIELTVEVMDAFAAKMMREANGG